MEPAVTAADPRDALHPLPAPTRTTRRPLRRAALATVVAAGMFGSTVMWRDSAAASPSLRLATVTTRSVTKTLDAVGTIEPVSAAAVAFPVAGTVAAVTVKAGDTVSRGQSLAALDTTSLHRAVDTANAALAQAKLALSTDTTSTTASSTTAATTTVPAATAATSQLSTATVSALDAARQAVLDAQRTVDADLQHAQEAIDSSTAVCAAATNSSHDSAPSSDDVEACRTALAAVLAAQQDVASAQTSLQQASTAYDAAIAQAASELSNAAATATNAAKTAAVNTTTGSVAAKSVSAADLAADQKAVDAAEAAVTVAEQAVAAATIVSPIDGTIVAVDMAPGDKVSASSTTSVVRVSGPGGYEVTAIVSVDKLANVKVGQTATVLPDAASRAIAGTVVAIGAPITTNGATTYPVSIAVDADEALRDGTIATVAITTAAADTALAVPTSAVHVDGTRTTVTVKDGNATKTATVTIGVIGKTWTQIKNGLAAGQTVVVADLSQALPGSATTASSSTNQNTSRGNFTPPTGSGPPPGFNGN